MLHILLFLQSPQNPFPQFNTPLGYSWGQSAYPRFCKLSKKYKKPLIPYEISG